MPKKIQLLCSSRRHICRNSYEFLWVFKKSLRLNLHERNKIYQSQQRQPNDGLSDELQQTVINSLSVFVCVRVCGENLGLMSKKSQF